MSASFYDLLKYAKTGIASPDMTGFDKLRALAMAGGGKEKTLTGIPPLSFRANGTPLISWSMLGNTQQTGVPSPDNIIMPDFCGVRTGNLFDKTDILSGYEIINNRIVSNSAWGVSGYIPVEQGKYYIATNTGGPVLEYETIGGTAVRSDKSITTGVYTPSETARFIRINFQLAKLDTIMLNAGSTALPYEPFGWKIPITSAGQTVLVYLGQTQTVRRIRKLVLTGKENWGISNSRFYLASITQDYLRGSGLALALCSHYASSPQTSLATNVPDGSISFSYATAQRLYCYDSAITTVEAFKSYLSQQYAAGTPVTIWYVLAEPQTGIINEPLCKIGDYADELSSEDAGVSIPTAKGQNTLTVDTELQPSSMTITFKG